MYNASATRYDNMKYNRTGKSGLLLPAISLGLWHNFGGNDLFENGRAMVRRALILESLILTLPIITVHPQAPPKKALAKFLKRI